MNGMETRRQSAQAAKGDTPRKIPNGNANGHVEGRNAAGESRPTENIFLFYPNIIGSSFPDVSPLQNGLNPLR